MDSDDDESDSTRFGKARRLRLAKQFFIILLFSEFLAIAVSVGSALVVRCLGGEGWFVISTGLLFGFLADYSFEPIWLWKASWHYRRAGWLSGVADTGCSISADWIASIVATAWEGYLAYKLLPFINSEVMVLAITGVAQIPVYTAIFVPPTLLFVLRK